VPQHGARQAVAPPAAHASDKPDVRRVQDDGALGHVVVVHRQELEHGHPIALWCLLVHVAADREGQGMPEVVRQELEREEHKGKASSGEEHNPAAALLDTAGEDRTQVGRTCPKVACPAWDLRVVCQDAHSPMAAVAKDSRAEAAALHVEVQQPLGLEHWAMLEGRLPPCWPAYYLSLLLPFPLYVVCENAFHFHRPPCYSLSFFGADYHHGRHYVFPR